MTMKYCYECGTKLDVDGFCANCLTSRDVVVLYELGESKLEDRLRHCFYQIVEIMAEISSISNAFRFYEPEIKEKGGAPAYRNLTQFLDDPSRYFADLVKYLTRKRIGTIDEFYPYLHARKLDEIINEILKK